MLILHDKNEIESFLRQNVFLHIYSIGDLDDFFWNHTTWYASKQNGEINAIILFYTGLPLPALLALTDNMAPMQELLQSILHLLPSRFYAHLSPGLEGIVRKQYQIKPHGQHYKMALKNRSRLNNIDFSKTVRLSRDDLADILRLYKASYPGNWFDARMLETGQYYGVRDRGELVSIAGVHVYSKQYSVAALGNITSHPDHRGQGLGKAVTARLCASLSEAIDYIGLNVKSDNHHAVSLYKTLGFEVVSTYGEYMIEAK
jgi:ribosomal protein S18 acetylase RimI-like enzyme